MYKREIINLSDEDEVNENESQPSELVNWQEFITEPETRQLIENLAETEEYADARKGGSFNSDVYSIPSHIKDEYRLMEVLKARFPEDSRNLILNYWVPRISRFYLRTKGGISFDELDKMDAFERERNRVDDLDIFGDEPVEEKETDSDNPKPVNPYDEQMKIYRKKNCEMLAKKRKMDEQKKKQGKKNVDNCKSVYKREK